MKTIQKRCVDASVRLNFFFFWGGGGREQGW